MGQKTANVGEIWLVVIPILEFKNSGNINVKLQKRPCLILDDGRGLIIEDGNRNYHVLKLTTQYDKYKRKLIKNWEQIGLAKKSYIRIEMPIKIEQAQFSKKITQLDKNHLLEIYDDIYKIINVDALERLSNKARSKQSIKDIKSVL